MEESVGGGREMHEMERMGKTSEGRLVEVVVDGSVLCIGECNF